MAEWRTILITLGLVSLCFIGIPITVDKPLEVEMFDNFIKTYNKTYSENQTEYNIRYKVFQKSLITIKKLNLNRSINQSALFGITRFSDLTTDEFNSKMLQSDLPRYITKRKLHINRKQHKKHNKIENSSQNSNEILNADRKSVRTLHNMVKRATLPQKVDWRDRKLVTPVRDQGRCGACWAHSVIATVESMVAKSTGNLVPLSVQEMIDCSYNNLGCGGGDTCTLLGWLLYQDINILQEEQYPINTKFEGSSGYCHLNETNKAVDNSLIKSIKIRVYTCDNLSTNEDKMLMYLATHGPLTTAINALTWQNYLGGVIQYHCDGQEALLNHAVQIVGYDLTAPIPFYIVRNSWGTLFGDNGYLYIAIGKNLCGIANEVTAIDVNVIT